MTTETSKAEAAIRLSEDEQIALSIYKPPFEFHHGYIFDAEGNMFADDVEKQAVARIRGWERISYMQNPEKLQDTVGELFAKALTDFWNTHGIGSE